MQFLFVDSNLFLQCRPLEELNWERLVGREDVTLLVPSAVLAELDKHKSDGNSRRSQRARRALQFLDSLLNAPDDSVVIRTTPIKVIAQFAPDASESTDASNDDSILFEVAAMTRKRGNEVVGLVTHDTNLKVKAKRKGLKFFPVPDEWLLAPEPDERDKRLRQLEQEVASLKKQAPIIEITLDGNQEIELVIPTYAPLRPETIERLVEATALKYPMRTDFSVTPSERYMSTSAIYGIGMRPPADWEIEKYQKKEYPEWKRSLHDLLEQFQSRLLLRDATAEVCIQIANKGTISAEHVHINVSGSDGVLLIDQEHYDNLQEKLLTPPRVPSPPKPGHISLDIMQDLHRFDRPNFPYTTEIPIRRARDEFYLKVGQDIDTEWIWECENMRHGAPPEEFSFRIGVNSKAKLSGGQLVIVASAENLPKAEEKKLLIKISYVAGDTEHIAIEWLGLHNS